MITVVRTMVIAGPYPCAKLSVTATRSLRCATPGGRGGAGGGAPSRGGGQPATVSTRACHHRRTRLLRTRTHSPASRVRRAGRVVRSACHVRPTLARAGAARCVRAARAHRQVDELPEEVALLVRVAHRRRARLDRVCVVRAAEPVRAAQRGRIADHVQNDHRHGRGVDLGVVPLRRAVERRVARHRERAVRLRRARERLERMPRGRDIEQRGGEHGRVDRLAGGALERLALLVPRVGPRAVQRVRPLDEQRERRVARREDEREQRGHAPLGRLVHRVLALEGEDRHVDVDEREVLHDLREQRRPLDVDREHEVERLQEEDDLSVAGRARGSIEADGRRRGRRTQPAARVMLECCGGSVGRARRGRARARPGARRGPASRTARTTPISAATDVLEVTSAVSRSSFSFGLARMCSTAITMITIAIAPAATERLPPAHSRHE